MKKLVIVCLYILLNLNVAAETGFQATVIGSKYTIRTVQQLPSINKVEVGGIGHLYIKQSNKNELIIEAEHNLIPILNISNKEGTLYLNQYHDQIEANFPIKYYLYTKNINEIIAHDKAKIFSPEGFKSTKLDLLLKGRSKGVLRFTGHKLKADIRNNAQLNIYGNAEIQNIFIGGSGIYNGKNLKGNDGLLQISDYGLAEVNITNELNINIQHEGEAIYHGMPHLKKTVSQSAKVVHAS